MKLRKMYESEQEKILLNSINADKYIFFPNNQEAIYENSIRTYSKFMGKSLVRNLPERLNIKKIYINTLRSVRKKETYSECPVVLNVNLPEVNTSTLLALFMFKSNPNLCKATGVIPNVVTKPTSSLIIKKSIQDQHFEINILGNYAAFSSIEDNNNTIYVATPGVEQNLIAPSSMKISEITNKGEFILPEKSSSHACISDSFSNYKVEHVTLPSEAFKKAFDIGRPSFLWPPFSNLSLKSNDLGLLLSTRFYCFICMSNNYIHRKYYLKLYGLIYGLIYSWNSMIKMKSDDYLVLIKILKSMLKEYHYKDSENIYNDFYNLYNEYIDITDDNLWLHR